MVPMFELTTETNGCEVIQLGAIYMHFLETRKNNVY
jgi:hypothetical protein